MLMSLSKYFIAVSSALALVVACDKDKSSETTTTGATIPATPLNNGPAPVPNDVNGLAAGTELAGSNVNDSAIERMTSARCVRALSCNQKKWTDDDACRRELRQTVRADFNVEACPDLSQAKVDECVESIRAGTCDVILGPSFGACLKATICSSN
jgi:hypothetical protein